MARKKPKAWVTALQIFRGGRWSPDDEFLTRDDALERVTMCIDSAEERQLDPRRWAIANFATGEFCPIDWRAIARRKKSHAA